MCQEVFMRRRFSKAKIFAICVVVVGLVFVIWTSSASAGVPVVSVPEGVATTQTVLVNEMTVFRSPTCGCCGKWIDYVKAAGFEVKDEITEDMDAVKPVYGVPDRLTSCHTAVIGGYVVEGHVSVEDVVRLLAERPNVAGITAPGMPAGSPGMKLDDDDADPYTVFSFTASGKAAAFATH